MGLGHSRAIRSHGNQLPIDIRVIMGLIDGQGTDEQEEVIQPGGNDDLDVDLEENGGIGERRLRNPVERGHGQEQGEEHRVAHERHHDHAREAAQFVGHEDCGRRRVP